MASALQQQLQQVSAAWGDAAAKRKKGRPSLLYDPLEAADIDVQTIHQVGSEGLRDLRKMDSRFGHFADSLFGSASVKLNREKQTKEVNRNLDTQIAAFCRVLADYFLLLPATKALEYLVRRYKVQEYNVDSLMACALPYHATHQFVRLVQILHIDNSIWAFLAPMKASGAPMPRHVLVQRSLNDKALLQFIGAAAKGAANKATGSKTVLAFYAVVVCEVIALAPRVDEDLVSTLLPCLMAGIDQATSVSVAYRASTFMIVTQLVSHATLSDRLLEVLMEALGHAASSSKKAQAPFAQQALQVLAHVVATQSQLAFLSPSIVKSLLANAHLHMLLAKLATKGVCIAPLLSLLVDAVFQHPPPQHTDRKGILSAWIDALPLEAQAEALATHVLEHVADLAPAKAEALQPVFRRLDARYPTQVNAAVNDTLKPLHKLNKKVKKKQTAPAAAQRNVQDSQDAEQQARLQRVFDFVQGALSGSLRAPTDNGATLCLAVDASSAHVRQLALQRLDAEAASGQASSDLVAFVHAALLRRLIDDDPAVVSTALQSPSLLSVPASALCDALQGCLNRLADLLAEPTSIADAAIARAAAKQAIKLLAGPFLAEHSSFSGKVAQQLLEHLMVLPHGRKVATAALRAAAKVDHPLFAELQHGARPKGRHLVLLALAHSCKAHDGSAQAEAALSILSANADALEEADTSDATDHSSQLTSVDSLPTSEHFAALVTDEADAARRAVQRHVLLVALGTLSAGDVADPQRLFAMLARLRPASLFDAHISALLDSVAASPCERAEFLSCSFGAPFGDASGALHEAIQERSLGLLASFYRQLPPVASKSKAAASQAAATLFPRLLLALSAPAAAHTLAGLEPSATAGGKVKPKGRTSRQKLNHIVQEHNARGLALPQDVREAVGSYLLNALVQQSDNAAGLAAAQLLLHAVAGFGSAGLRLQVGHGLLQRSLKAGQVASQLACDLLTLYTPEAVKAVISSDKAAGAEANSVLATFAGLLGLEAPCAVKVRQAALQMVTAAFFAELPPAQQPVVLKALVQSASRDSVDACRALSQAALEAASLPAAAIAPLLELSGTSSPEPPATPVPKRSRRAAAAASAAATAAAPAQKGVSEAQLADCILVLEMLQWKREVQDAIRLVPALCAVLRALLAGVEQGDPDREADTDSRQVGAMTNRPQMRSRELTVGGYAQQLALTALQGLAESNAGSNILRELEVSLVVDTAREAPDGAVCNAALKLLGVLATQLPDQTLQHVLEVVSLVSTSASSQDDAHSHHVAASTLASIVPAWLGAERSAADLVSAVVDALPGIPPHRRASLLSALLGALPQGEGLPLALLLLLRRILALPQKPAEGQQALQRDTEQAAKVDEREHLLDLATACCLQASQPGRVAALTKVLQQAVADAGNAPHAPLPVLAVGFATEQLQGPARIQVASATDDEQAAQEALRALLQEALDEQQALGSVSATSKRQQRSVKAASEGLSRLLAALEACMTDAAYLETLVRLMGHAQEGLVRRALRLFSAKVAGLATPDATEGEDASARGSQRAAAAEAALALCSEAARLLSPTSPAGAATRQGVLVALGALAPEYAARHAPRFTAVLPIVLQAATDRRQAVRSSALATTAAIITTMGSQAIGVLPKVVPAVLAAAEAATSALPSPGKDPSDSDEDMAPAGASDSDDEEAAPSGRTSVAEGAALEAATALAAVAALVDGVGAFLSPYLTALLQLLLAPRLLACSAANCSAGAAAVRRKLPDVIPARLLLGPLFNQLDHALKEGDASASALLAMVSTSVERMDAPTAAAHSDAIFGFLLRALDMRQQRPAGITSLDATERAAIAALVAATMKLSEARFKPLFLRLLDWSSTPPSSDPDAAPLGRQVAFFGAVAALTERLRSVFVPYFRHLLDPAIKHLGGKPEEPVKKKKKKKAAAGVAVGAPAGPVGNEMTWCLRLRVVQALHKCFLYDTVGFLEEQRFHRLLPPLVAQLAAEAPADVSIRLASLAADDAAGSSTARPAGTAGQGEQPAGAADVFGDATVAALVQMAVTAGNDLLWKPLNYQVLMATRSANASERQRALAVVAGLVGRVREDYLVLLPEALPFLAELLEDPELAIAAATQRLIKTLEELSGESLEQYLKA
ncbi:hypothetical protein WJX72_008160 [[Myrmecia] bisecta]|uniref:BP28 C-terminal domain-containing protein n=1 Tax=[Myrmecia] bisecta TaxID=41462 RepID=A0AAW1PKH6_9CHLO